MCSFSVAVVNCESEGVKEEEQEVEPKKEETGEASTGRSQEMSELEADNKQLRALLTSLQQKQQMTSLEVNLVYLVLVNVVI